MPAAVHVVDRIVAARSGMSFSREAIEVMMKMPALRFWDGGEVAEYTNSLSKNVPRWLELNDHLYWKDVADVRQNLERKGQRVEADSVVGHLGHFWDFGPADFERCLDWVRTKSDDDRAVALTRCMRLLNGSDRPEHWLAALRASVADNEKLTSTLEDWLAPTPSPAVAEKSAEHLRRKQERDQRQREENIEHANWVRELQSAPDRVRHPPGLKPGDFSGDQRNLLNCLERGGLSTRREKAANWQALIPEFGEAVARAYRDAAVDHWRAYRPSLPSEGADNQSTPSSLIFAMAGLAIEATEEQYFAESLTEDEAIHAFRYITWELNGFPAWFERLYRSFPKVALEAVTRELHWDLGLSAIEHQSHHVLHDVLYDAPWLHSEISPFILAWLHAKEPANSINLHYCLSTLASGRTSSEKLAKLAEKKAQSNENPEQRPRWFALWVDTDPETGIPALEIALNGLKPCEATIFAQQFAVGLLGDRHGTGARVGGYRNAEDLKKLYVLMHQFVRTSEDIERANKGVYSPTLRDNAQDVRNSLFKMLTEVPGPAAYAAIKALEAEHPDPEYRRWMAVQARGRATMDADEPNWTTEQVRELESNILRN